MERRGIAALTVQGRPIVVGLAVFIAVGVLAGTWIMKYRVEPAVFRAACRRGELDAVRRMLDRGQDPDAADPAGVTPLVLATANDHTSVVRLLLEAGAAEGLRRALEIAVSGCHPGPLAELLQRGGDPARLDPAALPEARERLADPERRAYCAETLRLLRVPDAPPVGTTP